MFIIFVFHFFLFFIFRAFHFLGLEVKHRFFLMKYSVGRFWNLGISQFLHFFISHLVISCHIYLPHTSLSPPDTCLSSRHMSLPQTHVSPPETCLSPRDMSLPHEHVSPPRTCLSLAQICLPAIEERSGRVKKAKIGPNIYCFFQIWPMTKEGF